MSKAFMNFCSLHGIEMELTLLYNPQQNGVRETKLSSLRMILSVENISKLFIHQMNFKTEFLNGKLCFMKQPSECESQKVCKPNKTIYELKQSSMDWYRSLLKVLLGAGFTVQMNLRGV